MICKNCGAKLSDGSVFCSNCGTKAEAPASTATAGNSWFLRAGSLDHLTESANTTGPERVKSWDAAPEPEPGKRKCRKCGAILSSTSLFCSNCGAKSSVGTSTLKEKPYAPKALFSGKNKTYAIVTVIICCIVVAAALLALLVLPNLEVNAFKAQIRAREYRAAYLAYEDFSSRDRTKANNWMRDYIDSVEEEYYAGKLDYSTAADILKEMLQFEAVNNKAAEVNQNVFLDNQSTIAFNSAKQYAEDEKWKEAYMALQNVHIKYRLYADVAALREEYAANYRTSVLEQLSVFAENGEIDKIIASRDTALTILPDDKEIIQAAQAHLDAYVTKTLADAKTLADSKDFAGAIDLLQYAISMHDHQDFWSALEGYGYDSAEAHCEALVAQNDLLGAVKYAKGLADADSKYSELLEKYATPLVDDTLTEAKTYADNRQFTEAIALISSVQAVYDCSELQAAAENYGAYLPRKLAECHQIDCSYDGYVEDNDHVDSFGKEHEDAIRFIDAYQDTYAVYSLDGKYVKLSGTLVADEDHKGSATVKIYVDDKLVYESKAIARTTEAFTFSVDVTGGKQLRIEVLNDRDHAYWSYIIVDATVS